MKALIVLDDKEKLASLSSKLTNAGFDTICYQWLMKALDNLEEISPHLVLISAEDYPRHWKVFVQHIKLHNDETKVFLITSSLTEEEQKKVEILGIEDIIYDIDSELQKVFLAFDSQKHQQTEPLSEPELTLKAEPVLEPEPTLQAEPLFEPEPTLKAEPLSEPEPTLKAEPLSEPEPALKAEPVFEHKPALQAEPVLEPEPALKAEPVLEPEPALKAEPLFEPEPALKAEPLLEPEPALKAEPLFEPEPTLKVEPLFEPEPALKVEPVLEPEPALKAEPLFEPEPALKAEPVFEPEPALKAEPLSEPEPALKAEPLFEPEQTLTAEPVLELEPVLERKIVSSCDFFITNPFTNRIICGKVKKYKYPTLIFIPNNQDEKNSLRFGQTFENCILKQVVNNKELSSNHRCQIRGFTDNSIEFCLLR